MGNTEVPLVAGGQGRSAQSLRSDAAALLALVVLLCQ